MEHLLIGIGAGVGAGAALLWMWRKVLEIETDQPEQTGSASHT